LHLLDAARPPLLFQLLQSRTFCYAGGGLWAGQKMHSDVILAAVIRSSLDCIVVVDEQGCVVEFNPAAEHCFGYSREEALGRPIAEIIIPGHLRGAHSAGFARYLAGGKPRVLGRRVEVEAMRKDGSTFPVELAITEVKAGGKRLFTASLRDLTERREMERMVRDSQARLSAFLDNAPAAMYLKDRSGRYALANRFMAERLGYEHGELIGKTPEEVLAPASLAEAREVDAIIRQTRAAHARETDFATSDGVRSALTIRFPVFDEAGEIAYIGGVALDVSAQKRAEQELQRSRDALYQSEKMSAMGSMLAGVSHELNNPLAIVVGEAILLEEEAEGTPLAESAGRINRAAERCSRIVQTFLAMARQKPPERTELNVNEAVEAAVELTAYGMRSNGVEVTCALAPGLPAVLADSDQIQQVLINLLINAQQALQEQAGPRSIHIMTTNDHGAVNIRVSDNGPGVAPDVARRIFDPFFTTKPQGSGTGIGLSYSQGVVEAHGGKLSLLAGTEGAAFEIMLPVESGMDQPPAQPAPVEQPARAGRALVVDDEPELGQMIARFLSGEGFAVEVAPGGREAIAKLAEDDFDLILSDLRMPDLDGPALHAWLAENRPHLVDRLGFLTGDTLGPAAVRFLDEAQRPVAEKPFTRQSLRALIREILSSSRAREAAE
jgi:two-component system NtrC family sensor kinase